MRVAVKNHALPVYKKNRIASLLCIFESTIQQNMFEILLYNPYNRLQIILKIKAQMSYWQLRYKI